MEDSGAILREISSFKDMLDQVMSLSLSLSCQVNSTNIYRLVTLSLYLSIQDDLGLPYPRQTYQARTWTGFLIIVWWITGSISDVKQYHELLLEKSSHRTILGNWYALVIHHIYEAALRMQATWYSIFVCVPFVYVWLEKLF